LLYFEVLFHFVLVNKAGMGMDESDLEGLAFPSRSLRETRFGPGSIDVAEGPQVFDFFLTQVE
jgi:hypothetical protein